jgi:AraC family L-rhamnose operon regulatory protein RhaS
VEHKRLRERFPLLREEGVALMVARSATPPPHPQRHTHDVVEIFCVRSGTGTDQHGERRHALRPGTVGIVHHGQSHTLVGGRVELVNLLLDLERLPPPDLGELAPALHAILPLHPSLRYRTRTAVYLDLPADGPHLAALAAMLAEQETRATGWREALRAHLRVFLVTLARRAADLGLHGDGRAFDTPPLGLERVRQRLDRSFDHPVRLPELARLAGCAPATLSRGFRRYTGETVVGYAHRLRIDAAKRALGATDDAIIAVARASGFGDLAFFNRVFKRRVGCTPSAWRRHALGAA